MKAFVFDFDGVLVDSERYWPETSPAFFAAYVDKPWTTQDQARLQGLSVEGSHEVLTQEYGLTLSLLEYERRLTDMVLSIYTERSLPMPGIRTLLERLSAMNATLGIASSSRRRWIDLAMQRLDLLRFFPVICSGDDVPGRAKPWPDVYLLAAKKLNVDPMECIAIEDSPKGIAAARAAGMTCIALHSEHNAEFDLSAADIHIDSFDELTSERLISLLA